MQSITRFMIPKPTHGSEEWLRVRWKDENNWARISASVASCVHGENPYKTAGELAVELMADEPPKPQTPTQDMERGNRLEPVLIKWHMDMTGEEIVTPDSMYCYWRLISTLDGVKPDNTPIEVKTTRKRWDGKLPRHWYWQGVQQALCTGSATVEWIIFDTDLVLYHHVQVVTSDEKTRHYAACVDFLEAVDEGRLPDVADVDLGLVNSLYPEGEANTVELPDSAEDLLNRITELRTLKKEVDNQEARLKGEVGLLLGTADTGTLAGGVAVTWKTTSRESFDLASFEKAHPALAAKFKKKQSYRVMKIHTQKGE